MIRFKNYKRKVKGKLIIKEYPTVTHSHSGHFRGLLKELDNQEIFQTRYYLY